ncbi:hypothetical protein FSP39_011423 [Pinctada imbricata]|uniref:Peptidase A2 domain-containing protein n=1 Tax=Pinctada imbricata TaxID=66713 RepID=A0AA89BSN9_PINIB|nr:hypothetical protein FSP39_011423 [Pinctada imbricata]
MEKECEQGENAQRLVVRRGWPFEIAITFNRPLEKDDDLRLTFAIGDRPLPTDNTIVHMKVSDKDIEGKWQAKFPDPLPKENRIALTITTPPDCIVGKWAFHVAVLEKRDGKTVIVKNDRKAKDVYVLFNPWNKDDQVYMSDEEWRNEYVMNENGCIFVGNKNWPRERKWMFGQTNSLDQEDEKGCLVGNWSGKYDDGTSPTSWIGSVKILQQYYREKRSVCYGQCWVFSGLYTTLCRTLGIPARSITNFASAHNTDMEDNTIDSYVYEDGEDCDFLNNDSVWNFHVWNEVFIARPDLTSGKNYGGWQACDATPQEQSNGIFQCGPMPVAAIKQGDITEGYDGSFIMAEVNADRVTWVVSKDDFTPRNPVINSYSVGKSISTKAIHSDGWSWREDVTRNYKYEEGSPQERAAIMHAKKARGDTRDLYQKADKVLKFDLVEKDQDKYGNDFKITLKVTNTSKSKSDLRTVGGCLTVKAITYTAEIFEMEVKYDDYSTKNASEKHKKDQDSLCMKMLCAFFAKESKVPFIQEDDFTLVKPSITMKPKIQKGKVAVGKEFDLEMSFENPLKETLTNCKLTFGGAKILNERVEKTGLGGGGGGCSTTKPTVEPQNTGYEREGKHTLYVNTIIEKSILAMLLDTGSSVTIIKKEVHDLWPEENRPVLEPVRMNLITATGESASFLGKTTVNIKIGEKVCMHDVLLADIQSDGILGMDFLSKYECDLQLGQGYLVMGGQKVICYSDNDLEKPLCCRVSITEEIQIPAESEILVTGKILDPFRLGSEGIVKPFPEFVNNSGVLPVKCYVSCTENVLPIYLVNFSREPCVVRKNTVAAVFEEITPIPRNKEQGNDSNNSIKFGQQVKVSEVRTENKNNRELPPNLRLMYDSCDKDLDTEERIKVKNFLRKHQDLFSKSDKDIGQTSLVEHTIETGDARPIKQRPYRIPLAKRFLAEAEIRDMAERGIIEPSNSPWCSNLVMVTKKDGSVRFCLDFRKLNACTIKDSQPLPRIDDTLDALSRA